MANVTLKGNPMHTSGDLPKPGQAAPDFLLTKGDLSNVGLGSYRGKKKILNIVPSLDTGTCAASARQFNQRIKSEADTVVLTVSCDLPFAQDRFCKAEAIENVITLSEMRKKDFGEKYGVRLIDGPLSGIFARAVVVVDKNDKVVYTQLVPEIANEPDYDKALAAARGA